ncbi:DUF5678 domain-containing protein [candidate division KSB1 bacterium]|nr:DUF5678 domain-containing protein [candidate division KSB1 bacterium]
MPEIQDQVQVFEAPQLPIPKIEDDPWLRDEQAFFFMLPELLKTLRGKWVAVHNGQVVDVGDSVRDVLLRVRERFPKTEVYIQLVDENLPVIKMRSPRKGWR